MTLKNEAITATVCRPFVCVTRSSINKHRSQSTSGRIFDSPFAFRGLVCGCASFVFTFRRFGLFIMEVKVHAESLFDFNKICRACLTEKGEMRSVFMQDDTTGQAVILAEMLMGFSSVQIENGDGLPSLICLQCVHQISRCYSFKQLCEQSDLNLRQYLGLRKPPMPAQCKKEELRQNSDFSSALLLDHFGLDSSSGDSDEDDFKDDYNFLQSTLVDVSDDEKVIAQKQLMKAAKFHKSRTARKKLLAKGGKAAALAAKKMKRNINQCNVCKKQFINLKSFKKHLRMHIEDRPFKCKLCPRGFTEENYLNNHMRTHVPDEQKPHECDVCKKRFIHVTLLNKHMLKHSGEKPFVCKICDKGCYAENSLLKHMKIHEKKEGDPGLLKHICDYCKTEFSDAQSLSIHIKQHTGDRPFVCNMCGKCFPQRFNLELHLRTHTGERPFQCEVCRNGYVSKASLKIHMRTHTNERPFVCNFCGKAFRQSGDLTSHKRLHGTEKPIECTVCQKRFTTVMKLKYHMRNHTGERPYVCAVCGRGFTVNTILLRHMRVHSGERPYVCVTCGKAFSQSSTLNTHMKVHAPSPKYNNAQQQEQRLGKFQENQDAKYHHQQQQQQQQQTLELQTRLVQTDNNRMMQNQNEPIQRMLQPDAARMLANDGSRILTDASHLLPDTRGLMDNARLLPSDGTRLLINVTEPPPLRLLVNDNSARLLTSDNNARLLTGDSRLVAQDNRLIANVNINDSGRLLGDGSRHLAVVDGSRMLNDKYLTNYDPYHRGHL